MMKRLLKIGLLLLICSCINEDLSVCERLAISYRVQIVTNISTTLHTELSTTVSERLLCQALQAELDSIFRDYAQDLNMLFYLTSGELYEHRSVMMNAANRSYELTIPTDNYQHVATANVAVEPNADLSDDADPTQFSIRQLKADTIDSYRIGIYSARETIEMDSTGAVNEFHVNLYLVNSAVAVVIDPKGNAVDGVDMWIQDMATGFVVRDSLYSYEGSQTLVRGRSLKNETELLCNYACCMPSPTELATPAAKEAPTRAGSSNSLWHILLRTRMANGTVTMTSLGIMRPLLAGYIGVFKLTMRPDGTLEIPVTAGASVALDWQEIHYPNIPLGE